MIETSLEGVTESDDGVGYGHVFIEAIIVEVPAVPVNVDETIVDILIIPFRH